MSRPEKPDSERSSRPRPVLLHGSLPDTGNLTECHVCHRHVTPAGGVQVTPSRYCCGACWKARSGRASSRMRLLAHVASDAPLKPATRKAST
jgi:hypothetical protein